MDKTDKDKNKAAPPAEEKSAPLPPPKDEKQGFADAGLLEPTRFGDWEVNGRCSDF